MKIVLVVLAFFSFSNQYAQDYLPMLELDHIWNTKSIGCPDPCITSYSEHQIVGEIDFNGVIYQRLSNGSSSCYVREDNGRLYVYNTTLNVEVLVFDFSLEIGDIYTFPDPYCNQPGDIIFPDMLVVDVSTQMIAGEMRKVIDFEDNVSTGEYIESWIEGIGSSSGVYSGGTNSIDSYTELACFTVDGMTYFFNGNTICFEVIGIDDHPLVDAILYPNPVTDISVLRFSSEGLVDTVKIFDVSGRLVKVEKVTKDYVRIDAMHYRSGLYFFQLIYKNRVLKAAKFIIK